MCNKEGCPECSGGHFPLDEPPARYAGAAAFAVLDEARFARAGILLEPGGLGAQPACRMDALRFVWDEEDYWKAKLCGPVAMML